MSARGIASTVLGWIYRSSPSSHEKTASCGRLPAKTTCSATPSRCASSRSAVGSPPPARRYSTSVRPAAFSCASASITYRCPLKATFTAAAVPRTSLPECVRIFSSRRASTAASAGASSTSETAAEIPRVGYRRCKNALVTYTAYGAWRIHQRIRSHASGASTFPRRLWCVRLSHGQPTASARNGFPIRRQKRAAIVPDSDGTRMMTARSGVMLRVMICRISRRR